LVGADRFHPTPQIPEVLLDHLRGQRRKELDAVCQAVPGESVEVGGVDPERGPGAPGGFAGVREGRDGINQGLGGLRRSYRPGRSRV
jgi:hypothetical protein